MGSWVKWGTYFKIENGDQPIYFFLTGNKFALIHVSIIRMCNKIRTDRFRSLPEPLNFAVLKIPLIFMLFKQFWEFTSSNLNLLIRHVIS